MEISCHSYPDLLASQIWQLWMQKGKRHFALHTPEELGDFLSYAYQASLLKEEGKGVTCRITLCKPQELEADYLKTFGFHICRFTRPRRFDEQEIRRLSPSSTFSRSIIAVTWSAETGFEISGVIQTGEWSRDLVVDIPGLLHPIPDWLIVHTRGPGNLVVHHGVERLATLLNGRIEGEGFNVFDSVWLRQRWNDIEFDPLEVPNLAEGSGIEIRDDFKGVYDTIFLKQIIRAIRDRRHGGTIVFAPIDLLTQFLARGSAMRVKYGVDLEQSRRPYFQLLGEVARRGLILAKAKGRPSFGWAELVEWSEEFSHTVSSLYMDLAAWLADMAMVDGCLLLDARFGVWGYGVEIQVPGSDEEVIHQALDLEARNTISELAEHVGTRHRTVYRLCRSYPKCLAIVVSQDGSVKFVINHRNRVTYWGQLDF